MLLKLRVLIALALDGAFDETLDRALDGSDRLRSV